MILVRRHGPALSGRGAGILGHHMEIRGLGIINVKDLFGIAAVREGRRFVVLDDGRFAAIEAALRAKLTATADVVFELLREAQGSFG